MFLAIELIYRKSLMPPEQQMSAWIICYKRMAEYVNKMNLDLMLIFTDRAQ